MDKPCEWYENWFDTGYYHLLYKKRDQREAAGFIDNLIRFLKPLPDARFLDLACGKGRHSIYLNQKGFDVTGIDLSANNISCARNSENSALRFYRHDMRKPMHSASFDFILNLFTSFGYFENESEDREVLGMVHQALQPQGVFVLDYFNASKPNPQFGEAFSKEIDSVRFDISKHINNGRIIKEIKVTDNDKQFHFSEQVRIYTLEQFKQMFARAGLYITATFGNYELEAYDALGSERLILIAQKANA